MSEQPFGGIWAQRSLQSPDHDEFMCIDESRGRIITFLVRVIDPVKYGAMRHWYRPESSTSITARLHPADEWRVHEVRLENDCLWWTYGGGTHPWRRVLPGEQPEWLEARLAAAHVKMDAAEKGI